MTNEKAIALIAKARDMAAASYGGTSRTLRDLADALEASLTVPDGDVRELIARTLFIASDDFAFADRMAKAWDAPGPHGRQRWYNYADAILAAFPVLGTAAPEPEWEYGTAHADDPQAVDMGYTLEGAQRRVAQWNAADLERKGIVVRAPKRVWESLPVVGESDGE